ncbi:major facilitator superfamily domain-containing protein [Coniella lustricola]|uniref:Major facilitator superfamily domain-containing protein n=1 Tax=Coniella lustricola TaxID=2025994 RepID=A0A2T3A6C4_9PEZI|nr:major facilitator superfamily domain-containing protein [Coniella lustricola]
MADNKQDSNSASPSRVNHAHDGQAKRRCCKVSLVQPVDGNARNLPLFAKVFITANLALLVFIITFASSILSSATADLEAEFHIPKEVAILATSIFVLGFAVGPVLFGPASEVLGRKRPLGVGVVGFAAFTVGVAVARDAATVLVCRFLGGVFGVASLVIAGGALADIWDPLSRGVAVAGFASATFTGPVLAPIVGGFVSQSYLGWRWTQWLTLIATLVFVVVYLIATPETYGPVVAARRDRRRAKSAKVAEDDDMNAKKRPGDQVDFARLARVYILKPVLMLGQEPILALMMLYMGFIYGFVYLCFEAYPVAFQQDRGWGTGGVSSLPFLAIAVGMLMGVAVVVVHTHTRMRRKVDARGGDVPEERLVPMMLGSVSLPVGIFWFAWTSSSHVTTWVPQVIAGIPIGCGICLVFLQGLNYLIDVYKMSANSAISINAMFRGLLGAGFPLFAPYMFKTLGVSWAMSLLGFLCIAMVPVPFLFYMYGERIRRWSKFVPST